MKTIITLLILLTSLSVSFAQNRCASTVPQNAKILVLDRSQIADFTITDTEGNELNLYSTLDQGKTVFLDLFFTTCSWCILYAPIIEEAYQQSGAGTENVLFWGISPQDNNQQIDAYKAGHGISNPCSGTDGNGPAAIDIIIAGQPFLGYPTYCVVCPDRGMQFDVCYPPTVTCLLDRINYCATILFPIFEPDTETIPAFHEVTFTDSSTGQPTGWEWVFEGGIPETSTEQNPVVTYETIGVFDVTLTVTDGTSSQSVTKEDLITVTDNVGINQQKGAEFTVSPNPTTGYIKLNIREGNGIAKVLIYNSLGTNVIQDQVILQSGAETHYNLSSFPKGMYMIMVNVNNAIQTSKVIVE